MFSCRQAIATGCGGAAVALLSQGAFAQAREILPAPAFDAAALTALPAEDWITNGGNLFNQRYSVLDQINRDNVENLKAVWRVSLESANEPGFSDQAQALVYDGVIYIVTGENDVFAVDVETGEFLWTYESDVDFESSSICCGRVSRGVGLGDGLVYLGRLDARLVALDQKTGDVVWDIVAADKDRGYGITAAPLYYNGMVIVGFSGGEFGIRGRITAYRAKTGEAIWNFYTVPGPGEIGHATWPQDSDVWQYGGAPIWQTPSVDPELGMIYFSTGNPGPSMNGAVRPGDNLFTGSIIALDVNTGRYQWHFQVVRHDIWDFDAPNPTILFDAEFDGMPRRAIAQVGKAGFLYILDRTSGAPLTPVLWQPVPQSAVSHTAATQPIPQGDWVIRHNIDAVGEDFDGVITNGGFTFNAYTADQPAFWRPSSGVSWQPSSFNIDNNLMYICAVDGPGGGSGGDPDGIIGPDEVRGYYVEGRLSGGRDVGADSRATLVAMDLTTHNVAWRRLLDDRCAGTITTAGGLIFAGRYNGELTALDSDTGRRLWSFQTDGGFTTTATAFLHNGTQYLVGLAGGSLTGGKINDGLWLFSLDGTMESLPPSAGVPPPNASRELTAEQQRAAAAGLGPAPVQPIVDLARVPDRERGGAIYHAVCVACHGENGEGGHEAGVPFTAELTLEQIVLTAGAGVDGTAMTPFGSAYSPEELHDVASFILEDVLP